MTFENHMLACANHESNRQKEAESLGREQDRLASQALAEAQQGTYSKLLSAMDYHDLDAQVMRCLCRCAADGDAEAQRVTATLARVYATHRAEVT